MKPSKHEEEYIAKLEFERRKKLEEEKRKKIAEEEAKALQELHYMHCPKCGHKLIEIEYNKTKIDKCSFCHGIFLDNGELETIMEMEKSLMKRFFKAFH